MPATDRDQANRERNVKAGSEGTLLVTRYRNTAAFVVLAILWGSAFIAIKAGLRYFPPVFFAAVRYDVAGLLMLAYAWYRLDDPIPRGRKQWAVVVIGSVLLIAAYHALLFIGEDDPTVTGASAAVLVSLSPVLTTGFARGFLPEERLSTVGFAGVVLGLVGAVVLADPNPHDLLTGAFVAKSLVFGAAASFALGGVLTRRIDADLPIESMEAWSMLGGAILMHVISLGLHESVASVPWGNVRALSAMAYLSIGASAVGFLIYFDLLDRLGPVQINLVSYVAPIFAAVTGWAILKQQPDAATGIGFVFIFTGFLFIKQRAVRGELPRLRGHIRTVLGYSGEE